MKKTQILSVIALAFALGVVAPVSSVVMTSDTYAYDTVAVTADLNDVNNAIAYVKNNALYNSMVDVFELYAAYSANPTAYPNLPMDAANKQSADATNVLQAVIDANTAASGIGKDGVYGFTAIPANFWTEVLGGVNQINDAIDIAQSSALYNAYANVIADLELNDTPANNEKLQRDVAVWRTVADREGIINAGVSGAVPINPSDANISDYKVNNLVRNANSALYDASATIRTAVNTAVANRDAYITARDAFLNALQAAGVLTAAGQTALNAEIDTKTPQPSAMVQIIADSANGTNNYINDYALWNTLWTDMKVADTRKTDETNYDNYDLIQKLAGDYREATHSEKATSAIAAEMAKYVATTPVDPSDPSEVPTDPTKPTNPSVDGNGNGSEGGNGVAGGSFGAPKTGAIAKSEGSASTSVAIMAAISTVVAGLGAAVVAIRNFKRNKNA